MNRKFVTLSDAKGLMHELRYATALGGLLTLLATTSAAAQDARLTGTVLDAASSRPLIGAAVTVGTRSTRTDERGVFTLPRMRPATYPVAVRALGYGPVNQSVTITEDTSITIALIRIAALDTVRVRAAVQAIYGVVATAPDLRPLANATVTILGSSVGEAVTDSSGHFFYPVKMPGSYLVRGRSPGLGPEIVSVTVAGNEGVEVALLLDSLVPRGANALEMAFADFRERLLRRTRASTVVPRAELQGNGNRDLVSSLLTAPSFGSRPLRFSSEACVFVDGVPRGGLSPNAFDPRDVETVEVYSSTGDPTGTLARRWTPGMPCGDTGMPRTLGSPGRGTSPGSASDIVRWVVIWLKH